MSAAKRAFDHATTLGAHASDHSRTTTLKTDTRRPRILIDFHMFGRCADDYKAKFASERNRRGSVRNRTDNLGFQFLQWMKSPASSITDGVDAYKAAGSCDGAAPLPEVPCQNEAGGHHAGSPRF